MFSFVFMFLAALSGLAFVMAAREKESGVATTILAFVCVPVIAVYFLAVARHADRLLDVPAILPQPWTGLAISLGLWLLIRPLVNDPADALESGSKD